MLENNYENQLSFNDFFNKTFYICGLSYANVLNVDTCEILEFSFENNEK